MIYEKPIWWSRRDGTLDLRIATRVVGSTDISLRAKLKFKDGVNLPTRSADGFFGTKVLRVQH